MKGCFQYLFYDIKVSNTFTATMSPLVSCNLNFREDETIIAQHLSQSTMSNILIFLFNSHRGLSKLKFKRNNKQTTR